MWIKHRIGLAFLKSVDLDVDVLSACAKVFMCDPFTNNLCTWTHIIIMRLRWEKQQIK